METGLDQTHMLGQPIQQYSRGRTKKLTYNVDSVDFNNFNNDYKDDSVRLMETYITRPTSFRLAVDCNFYKPIEQQQTKVRLWGVNDHLNVGSNLNQAFDKQIDEIEKQIDKFTENGSGWTLTNITQVRFEFYGIEQLRGGSTFINLPTELVKKKACINVKNKDNHCFKWSILSALHPASTHSDRLSNYKQYENDLNDTDFEYPIHVKDVQRFADKNKLIINVFGYEGKVTIYHTDSKIYKEELPIINLLLYSNHYVWIKNMSALLFTQSKHNQKRYTCLKCLNNHNTQANLDMHIIKCIQFHDGESVVEMPAKGSKTKFKNIKNMLRKPYVIYADFESLIKPLTEAIETGKTEKTDHHEPSSYCLACVRSDGQLIHYDLYRGENVINKFYESLDKIGEHISNQPVAPIIITPQQEQEFKGAQLCYLCNKPFADKSATITGGVDKNWKVRDHDHITGYYRGAAHNNCNLLLRPDKNIPVVIHNFRGYDSHLLVSKLTKSADVIANNKEKFMSMTLDKFRFIDSLQFLNSSLAKLVEGLKEFRYINYLNTSDLLKQKGIFPYEYITDHSAFNETELPPKEAFASSLDGYKGISESDYQHAQNVWKTFNIQNLGQYNDLYLATDVLLLADVFETFRDLGMRTYRLDPANYITTPSFAWDALLLKTGIELDNITDVNMYQFVESGIRGGISTVGSLRMFQANNKYMGDEYDVTKPSIYVIYEDMNNLYGWAMSQPMPTGGFRWIDSIDELKSTEGYIAEVDLEYPKHLHDSHNCYPLAPIHMNGKMMLTLEDKKNYVIHYETLKLYVKLGLKIKAIHKILAFKERPWMKDYIDMNTEMRKEASTDFEKDFFKLMNNAVFGKSMENVRNRIDVRLLAETEQLEKIKRNPKFRCTKEINDDLSAVLLTKTKCVLNKPIYIGMSILDVSKVLMYKYWYNELKYKFGDNIRLMYTDTDSFVFAVVCDDYFKTINLKEYDISNWEAIPEGCEEIMKYNKKRIGIPKSELGLNAITSFVALRSKMYSAKTADKSTDKSGGVAGGVVMNKAKGISRYVVKGIAHEEYVDCVVNNTDGTDREMNVIRPQNHDVYNMKIRKKGLSPKDDKRHYINNVMSLAHGHNAIAH